MAAVVQPPFVSVIIPVFNDLQRLELCLDCLKQQTYDPQNYEVIIVDNNSIEAVSFLEKELRNIKVIREEKPGSYAARNKGIALARGTIIAFTDSDCLPETDWISQGVKNLLSIPNCGLVAGRIKILLKDDQNPTVVELYEKITAFPQKQYIEKKKFGVTANLFTFKDIFEVVGYFNEDLKSGGDKEWGQRVFMKGYQLHYAEDTCVAHPARSSLKEILQKVMRVADESLVRDSFATYNSTKENLFSRVSFISCWCHFLPSLDVTRKIFWSQDIRGFQKLNVLGVMMLIKYARAYRLMQVKLKSILQR